MLYILPIKKNLEEINKVILLKFLKTLKILIKFSKILSGPNSAPYLFLTYNAYSLYKTSLSLAYIYIIFVQTLCK